MAPSTGLVSANLDTRFSTCWCSQNDFVRKVDFTGRAKKEFMSIPH